MLSHTQKSVAIHDSSDSELFFTQKRQKIQLQQHLERLIKKSEDTLIITDCNGITEHVNPAFERVSGFGAADIIGKTPNILKSGEHDAVFYRRLWSMLLSGGTFRADFINRRSDGSLFQEDKTITPLQDEYGRITHFAAIGRSITSRVKEHQRMFRLAYYDSLTGLPNRTLITDRLNQALKRVRRNHELVAVMFLDLDGFKNINDSLGHDMGDRVIKAIATRLRCNIREYDSIARLGGDEFVILLEDVADRSEVASAAGKLLTSLAEPYQLDGHCLIATASIGVALAPHDGHKVDQLLKNADSAMYQAKAAGGGACVFFNRMCR